MIYSVSEKNSPYRNDNVVTTLAQGCHNAFQWCIRVINIVGGGGGGGGGGG